MTAKDSLEEITQIESGSTSRNYMAKVWQRALTSLRGRRNDNNLPKEDEKLTQWVADIIDEKDGEVANKARTLELGMAYLDMPPDQKQRFFKVLAAEFDVDRDQLEQKNQALAAAESEEDKITAELALRKVLVSPRIALFRQLNLLPDGFKFLINMRADLHPQARKDPSLRKLDEDLKILLASWFDLGLLDLKEITWNSPASLLEKLMEYEAVHAIKSWDDMKHRLYSDRRCFGFFHSKMPNTPLIFVEVALVNGMADNIQNLLNESSLPLSPEEADTAIFYSISNTQKGLAGIRFGNFLIKTVVDLLAGELKNIKDYATLSPVPGFTRWLVSQKDTDVLAAILSGQESDFIMDLADNNHLPEALLAILETDWHTDPAKAKALKNPLMKLCAHYIIREKKRGHAADPVTHFHMTNGARLERINWLADTSAKGLKNSAGIMVNYNYILSRIARKHEKYMSKGFVGTSREARQWLK